MTTITKGLFIAVAVLSLSVGALGWQLRSAHRATAEAAIAPAKQAVKEADAERVVAKAQVDTAAHRLAKSVHAAARIIHDTVPMPPTVLHPVTSADTGAALAAVPMLAQKFGACREQLSALSSDCVAYRASAENRFRTDSASLARRDTVIAKQDAVIAGGLVPRRWSVGVTAGYGGVFAKDTTGTLRLYTGLSVVVGVSLRVW